MLQEVKDLELQKAEQNKYELVITEKKTQKKKITKTQTKKSASQLPSRSKYTAP